MADTLNTQGNTGVTVAWSEFIDDPGLSDASFASDGGQATLIIQVEHGKNTRLAVRDILGWSERVKDKLVRHLPMRHPFWHWMYATKISNVKFLGSQGTTVSSGLGKTHSYTRTNLTVVYSSLPYEVKQDWEIYGDSPGQQAATPNKDILPAAQCGEWGRFVEKKFKPLSEYIASDRGDFKFTDSAAASNGKVIKMGVPRLVHKGLVEWKWHYVPYEWLMNYQGVPTNLMSCVGKVNKYEFAGFPAGTLLLENFDLQPVSLPVDPSVGFDLNIAKGTNPPRIFNVTLPFKYIDPPTSSPPTATTYDYRGHALRPDPADTSGRWYRITTVVGGTTLYPAIDFKTIFAPVSTVNPS